jgi:hypothetical protein
MFLCERINVSAGSVIPQACNTMYNKCAELSICNLKSLKHTGLEAHIHYMSARHCAKF